MVRVAVDSLALGAAILALAGLPAVAAAPQASLRCDPDDGGIVLPEGLCALVFADDLGRGRHLAVNGNGDVYLRLRKSSGGGTVAALRDTDGDGRADLERRFGEERGTGIEIRDGYLYAGTPTGVVRWRLDPGELVPSAPRETVVGGFPEQDQHEAKSFAFDSEGRLYVNVGSPSNSCQKEDRERGSPGLDPCPQLERHAGVWRFDAGRTGQTQRDGVRFATGIRGVIALAWKPETNGLYGVQHGRDSLHDHWPDLFTERQSADLPAEELLRIRENDDFGWPYCYYDHFQKKKVLAPEYGGDGKKAGRCADAKDPLLALPAHWAPNDLIFYHGRLLGERYRGGAFVAFHGSWNRGSFPEEGYQVVFVPFASDRPKGGYETFADGFTGKEEIDDSGDARFRPTGLAEGPDGSLYVADSVEGRIWRVIPD